MTDLLYPLARSGTGEELRYSLRSVAAHMPHDRIFVVGPAIPDWLVGVEHIPTREGNGKWANIMEAMRTACAASDLSSDVVYMNDDFFVMEPVLAIPIAHRGPLVGTGNGSYSQLFAATGRVLRELSISGPLRSYELHMPFAFNKGAMATVLRMADPREIVHTRSLYANYWSIGGEHADDVKVRGGFTALPRGPFISTSSASWRGPAGAAIRATFTQPSIYEE